MLPASKAPALGQAAAPGLLAGLGMRVRDADCRIELEAGLSNVAGAPGILLAGKAPPLGLVADDAMEVTVQPLSAHTSLSRRPDRSTRQHRLLIVAAAVA